MVPQRDRWDRGRYSENIPTNLQDDMEPTQADPSHLLDPILVMDRYVYPLGRERHMPESLSGWFPFLFFGTTWVGETHFRYDVSPDVMRSEDRLGDVGRVGSFSLVIFSLISLAGSVALPWIVRSPDGERGGAWTWSRFPPRLATLAWFAQCHQPDLLTTWTVAHFIFSGTMFLAPFVRSVRFATTLVAVCGM